MMTAFNSIPPDAHGLASRLSGPAQETMALWFKRLAEILQGHHRQYLAAQEAAAENARRRAEAARAGARVARLLEAGADPGRALAAVAGQSGIEPAWIAHHAEAHRRKGAAQGLAERNRRILQAVARGETNAEIGRREGGLHEKSVARIVAGERRRLEQLYQLDRQIEEAKRHGLEMKFLPPAA